MHSSPLVLYRYAIIVLGFFIISTWNFCFWRKTTQFTKLIYETSNCSLCFDKAFFRFKKISLYVSPLIVTIIGYLGEWKVINGNKHFPEKNNATSISIPDFKWNHVPLLVQKIPFLCSLYMGSCFDFLSVVIAFSAYDFTKTHLRMARASSSLPNIPGVAENKPNIRKMVRGAKEMQAYFGNLNDFYSNIFLLWFCIEFPWIPLQMVRISNIQEYGTFDVINVAYTWMCTSFYVATGILFSESRKNVSLAIQNFNELIF